MYNFGKSSVVHSVIMPCIGAKKHSVFAPGDSSLNIAQCHYGSENSAEQMLCFKTLGPWCKQHTNTHEPSIAGSGRGRVSVLFGFLCHLWLWAIMSTSSADLQGWGGSCRTELSWLSIWWEEAAYGTPLLLQTEEDNTPNNLHFSPIALANVAW